MNRPATPPPAGPAAPGFAPRARPPLRLLGGAVLLLLFLPEAAAPQGRPQLDAGQYALEVGDRRVGTEAFAIRRSGQSVRAVGRVQVDSILEPFATMEVWLQTDLEYRPTLVRIQPESGDSTVVGVQEGNRFRVQITTERGTRFREFLAGSRTAVLEPTVAHHYYLLFRRISDSLSAAGEWSGTALLPSEARSATITVRGGEADSVSAGGRRTSARRYTVEFGDRTTRVWLDGEKRVLRLTGDDGRWAKVRISEQGGGG